MPKRLISSELFLSADLMDLPAVARLLFAGLICNADDEGIGRAETDYLRTKVLPGLRVGRAVVEGYLRTFEERDMISVRRLNGVTSYICSNWHRYQKLSRPRKSKYKVAPEEKRREENRIEDEVNATATEDKKGSFGPLPFSSSPGGKESEAQTILVDEIARELNLGYAKAGICVYERGVTREDWQAWKAYEQECGTRLTVMNIQRYRNPSEIKTPVEGEQPKSFRERDTDQAKAEARRLREKGENK